MCSYCGEAAFQAGNYAASAPGSEGTNAAPVAATGIASSISTGNNNIDGLLSGYKWGSTSITWRIPESTSDYDTNPNLVGLQYGDLARLDNWLAPTAAMTTATSYILNEQFSGVSMLKFTAVTSADVNADMTIGRSGTASDFQTAYAYYPTGPGSDLAGDSWFSDNYDTWGSANAYSTPTMGGYNWYVYMHEYGHNMGLKHGNDAGGVRNVSMNADRDSMEFSIMTYRSHIGSNPQGGTTNENWGYAQSLMMYDIAALQVMYGANFAENGTNTVYSFSAATGEMFVNGVGEGTPGGNRIFRTVWDGNGIDTYDLSNYTTNLAIDLTPGGWSVFSAAQLANLGDGNFARGNLFNALQFNGDLRSLIENAIGGSGNDTLIGNNANNVLTGNAGADTINGGNGIDTANYASSNAAININLGDALAESGGHAQGDILTAIENVIGSNFDDAITGSTANNVLQGLAGADRLFGGAGADILEGGAGDDMLYGGLGADQLIGGDGFDFARYDDAAWGNLVINMAVPTRNTGSAAGDTYSEIEGIIAGSGNDTVTGNSFANTLYGGGGNDTLNGGLGKDTLYGGTGADKFVFNTALNAVSNVDQLADFTRNIDDIVLSRAIFGGIGTTLNASEFQIGPANSATDRIIYNQVTGQLFYDSNGNRAGGETLFATVNAGTVLTIADFIMIA